MTVETHVEQALARVREEQVAIEGKQTAYKHFVSGVEKTSVEPSTTQHGLQTTTGPVATMHSTPSGRSESRKQVRELFADTVRPHSTADIADTESLPETIAAELSEKIAVALAPQNVTTGFTSNLKNGILSEVAQRQHELRAMERALDREEESLVGAKDVTDEVLQWIVDVNETRLTELDFEALRVRHDRLDGFHDHCATVVRERQSLLHATTSADGKAGIAQQELVKCLYVAFPVTYPVLSTVVRVEQVCDECQRAIRDHLVRRV
jgi:hypothetical protein